MCSQGVSLPSSLFIHSVYLACPAALILSSFELVHMPRPDPKISRSFLFFESYVQGE